MATAYDVMSMAKRQGAEVKAVENYDKYMKAIRAEETRASKAGMFGKIGGGIGGSIASFLAPAAIAALGIGTGGIGSMLLAGALGTGVSRGGTEIGDFLARQWKMGGKGRGKEFKAPPKMKGIYGAYGQRYASKLQRGGKEAMETQRDTIAQMLDIENTNRWISSAFSGLQAAGKARSGFETMKGTPQATMGDKMQAALKGDIGEGYGFGAKDTGDWWQQKGIDRSLAKNIITPNELTSGAKYLAGGGDIGGFKNVGQGSEYTEIGGFAPLSVAEAPAQAMTMPTAAPSRIPSSFGRWQGGMTPYSAADFALPSTGGGLDTMSILQNILKSYESTSNIGTRQFGTPRKSLTMLQQLLQGGR